MEIKGKVHCFFEQSGTFKNEFIKLGIPAEDYDIQNNFGQTDHTEDLFAEIEKAYMGGASVFDSISCNDLIVAFFPCIYFEAMQMMEYTFEHLNQRGLTTRQKFDRVIERIRNRERFLILLYQLVGIVQMKGLRLIIENPATKPHYLLLTQVFLRPALIDKDRTRRGDYFKKPTAYWFVNCNPMVGYFTEQQNKEKKRILDAKSGIKAGICSEERSMISPDYARNFICDFILGKPQPEICPTLFD